MKTRDYLLLVLLAVLDQLTKIAATTYLQLHVRVKIVENFFYLTLSHNTGAAWSILEGQSMLFIVFAIAATGYIIYYLNTHKTINKWMKLSLIMIAAGAIGNVIDRIIYGYVIDFLDFYIFGYDFPVFNFADSCITVGMFILALCILLDKE